MQIGSFGTIVFKCSDQEVLTFKGFKRKRSANFVEHAVLDKKAKLQPVGVSLQIVNFTVQLNANFTNPEARLSEFWDAQESCEPRNLVVGGKNFGKFVIPEIEELRKDLGANGKLINAELQLSLKEYN